MRGRALCVSARDGTGNLTGAIACNARDCPPFDCARATSTPQLLPSRRTRRDASKRLRAGADVCMRSLAPVCHARKPCKAPAPARIFWRTDVRYTRARNYTNHSQRPTFAILTRVRRRRLRVRGPFSQTSARPPDPCARQRFALALCELQQPLSTAQRVAVVACISPIRGLQAT